MCFETIRRCIANFEIYFNSKLVLVLFGEDGIFIPSIPLLKQFHTNFCLPIEINKDKTKTIEAVYIESIYLKV